ncbi:MAG: hypothetical protein ACE5SW_07890 [Nitrososphaeraceae archaeon]
MNKNINMNISKDRRHGRRYNKEELRKNFKEIIDQTLKFRLPVTGITV